MLHQILTKIAQENADKTAVIADTQEITYGELIRNIYTLSDMLIVEGLRKADRVLILLNNPIEIITSFYGILRAGGTAILPPKTLNMSDIQRIYNEFTPWLIISDKEITHLQLKSRETINCPIFNIEKTNLFRSRQNDAIIQNEFSRTDAKIHKLLNLNEDDGSFIILNHITTNHTNAIVFTQSMIQRVSANLNRVMKFQSDIRQLSLHHLNSIEGLLTLTHILTTGSTIVFKNNDSKPLEIVQTMIKHRCNAISANSKTFTDLVSSIGSLLKEVASQLELIELHGATPKLFEKKKFLKIFPKTRLFLYYGTHEAPASTVIELRSEHRKIDTIGKPIQDIEVTISVNNTHQNTQNPVGEMLIRGVNTTAGYWRQGKIQTDCFFDGKCVATSDVGYIDNKGYVHLLGKKDEIIDIGGVIISPIEIEEKIHEVYPEYNICVVGIPNPDAVSFEIPVLCYIARDGKTIIPSELFHTLSLKLRQYQIPRIVYRVDSFPKSGSVILRNELRKELIERLNLTSVNYS
jgi:acyl-CoA synthetase (AMP-forming)/AMP-acid ligase II